jgi:dipeptidyl aminopeptidase/acylaminoacyl peptidase
MRVKRDRIAAACVLVLFFGLAGAAFAAEKHPFRAEDWAALRDATAIAVAPDGETILYRVDFGGEKGPTQHEWRLIASNGSNPRKLTLPEHFTPAGFTKEGTALYGSFEKEKEKEKVQQLAIVPIAGGDPKPLMNLPRGIHAPLLSSDGSRFVVLADPRPPDALAEVHTVVENDETSLYVVNADGTAGAWWCPALHDITDIAWSPDGLSIAVLSQTPKIGHHDVHSMMDVCSVSGARRLAEIANAASGIAWANRGAELVFLSTTTEVLTPDHVWTIPAAGGTPVDRTPDLSGSAANLAADPHGTVWVVVERGVQREIDSFQNDALAPAFRWPGGVVAAAPVFPQLAGAPDRLAFTVGDPERANNVAVADGGELKAITEEGRDQISQFALGPRRVVHWTSKEGIALEGIATFPPGYVEGRRYPFLVLPHGGPEGNDLLSFDAFTRFIAGMGYVVLQPQYRGSTGYGSAFLNAIYQHFGDRAFRDVDSATDFAIAQGWADPQRLAIYGWSAGGFMTSWTVTQTKRYRAAIEGAGITDWLSFIPTSDLPQVDYDQRWPERNPEPFLKFSAIMYADQVSTPLLILHGAADIRVPTFQGREFYVLLAERGKTVRMVTYPGSPHFPRLWEQRRDVFHEIAAWLERYNPPAPGN